MEYIAKIAPQNPVFLKNTLVRGETRQVRCREIEGQIFQISRGPVSIIHLEDEWYEDVEDPQAIVAKLMQDHACKPDLFTFWQRIPDVDVRYPFHYEWQDLAVLRVTSYQDWWTKRIKSRTRSLIRKAERDGVHVSECSYDDAFIEGMTRIFNEAPVRQGRRFWHYGKDFETVKRQFSQYIHREQMLGAYFEGEMIGFMMLGDAGRFCITGQVLSSLKHRDKAVNNILISSAVRFCENRGFDYLSYFFWSDDSLAEFKRRCGFERVQVPRYYVPLTWKGTLAIRTGAHRGWRALVPPRLTAAVKQGRSLWYRRQAENSGA